MGQGVPGGGTQFIYEGTEILVLYDTVIPLRAVQSCELGKD